MFERPEYGERAVLVHIDFADEIYSADLQEFKELVLAAGAQIAEVVVAKKNRPEAKFFIGSGKVQEISLIVKSLDADIVIFNHNLTPGQERNLEKEFSARVLARTGLILDIFAQRALTFEGKLQVELAQLKHVSTRLIRGWTHLERQKGGIGLRGPGETQLESDRRLIKGRIQAIEKKLEKVKKQRDIGRKSRQKGQVPSVALVGYTNAGKSTLFNTLTDAKVFASDMLFATLDPTLRNIELPVVGKAVLADTVGFIRNLPHQLVAAFQATLEETKQANLLLHVVDASDEMREEKISRVNEVLKEVGALDVPQLIVYNKIDLLVNTQPRIILDDVKKVREVWLSANDPKCIDLLKQAVSDCISEHVVTGSIELLPEEYEIKVLLDKSGGIVNETVKDNGCFILDICVSKMVWSRLCKKYSKLAGMLI